MFILFEKSSIFRIVCCRVILIFYEFQFRLKICPSKRHREFKRVEIRTGANFPNRSSPLLDTSASRANQSEGESKIARLIALFRTWCQTSQSWKNFLDERLVAECLWFVQLPDILHWVARECRLKGKQGEKYKQKSGTNTERGQPGGRVDFSLVQCGGRPWHVFGRFAGNWVKYSNWQSKSPKISCYFCFHLNDNLTELLGVVDDGWFS